MVPNSMERWFLLGSTLCFLCGFAYTMYALGARVARPSRWNFIVMLLGFALQTGFLHVRGKIVGRCPLTNFFEVLMFLSWSIVLLYFVIGGTYRLSLLGTFTAPLVFIVQGVALLLPSAQFTPIHDPSKGFWAELHAAISLMSFGAFAMAFVAGVMYLVQERLLKRHRLNTIYQNLPPIHDLAFDMQRVLIAGLGLLTLGLLSGFIAGRASEHWPAIVSASIVWVLYSVLLILRWTHRFSARRLAWLSVAAFTVALTTLGALNYNHLK